MILSTGCQNKDSSIPFLTKAWMIMKLTIVLLLFFTFRVSANGYAQQITIVKKNASLTEVFKAIERQTDYLFFYDKALIEKTDPIDVDLKRVTIDEALSACLKGVPLTYSIVSNTVVIREKDKVALFKTQTILTPMEVPERPPIEIRGNVKDEKGNPLANASVIIKGTKQGVTTNANGDFNINVPSTGTILIISYTGYATKEILVSNQTTININLVTADGSLGEVVVTALGIKREEKSLVYATQIVKPKDMVDVQDPNNFLNSFQGKISNALITQSLGGVGSDVSIVLRGDRSIQGSSEALIVVDGVPSNSNTPMVNPNDIESITVLKGASAGALYGSQAGNGVIVITTKTGNRGKVLVNLNSGATVNSIYGLPPMQNSYGQGTGGGLDAMSGSSWGAKMEGQTYTDYKGNTSKYSSQPNNINDFYEPKINLSNSISVSGGSDNVQGYLSYLNESKKGIVPTNDLMSHTVNTRVTAQISKRFSVDGNISHLEQKIKDTRRGQKQYDAILLFQTPRSIPFEYIKDYETIDNAGLPTPKFWPSPDRKTYSNPYWVLNRYTMPEDLDQSSGYLKATYKITPWLNVTGNANLSKSFIQTDEKVSNGVSYNPEKAGGTLVRTNTKRSQKWFDIIFGGKNNIVSGFDVNYHFGAIYKDNSQDIDVFTASGLNIPNTFSLNYATTSIMNSVSTEIQTQSIFGQVSFSYKDLLFIDGSLRNDWSSLLPPPHSYQYYSAGISGILSSLFDLPSAISYLKTSVNYAEVGNGGQFGLLSSTYSYKAGAGNGYLLRSSVLPFPNLKPEIIKNWELNLVSKLFNNRLSAEVTYYQSNSFNQLLSISVPPATGYNSKYINAGNIRNRGIEVTLGVNPIRSANFNWNIDLNFSLNRNKVIALDEKLKTVYLNYFSSNTITTQVTEGGAFGDLYSNYWMKNTKGQYLVNTAGLPSISDKSGLLGKIIGNFNPREMLGMTNTFNYKSFSLRLLLDGRIGGEVVSGVDMDLLFDGGPAITEKFRQGGWNLNGVDESGSKVTSTITAQQFWQWVSSKRYGVGEFFTYDATNIRVRELALGYGIPASGKSFFKSARISLTARNLFFLYKGSSILDIPGLGKRKMWFDPDMTGGGVQNQFSFIPPSKVIGLNLNVNF